MARAFFGPEPFPPILVSSLVESVVHFCLGSRAVSRLGLHGQDSRASADMFEACFGCEGFGELLCGALLGSFYDKEDEDTTTLGSDLY